MKKFSVLLILVWSFAGCLKEQRPTCNYNECAFVVPAAEIQQVQEYLTANSITATQHCSGLFYTIDNPGTGTAPTPCSGITFSYEGKLTNGTVFDKSTNPISYHLSGLIQGFRNGIPLIKPGGQIRLYIPPSLGYGSNPPQGGTIPPNAVLVFDVNLLGVQ